MGITSKTLIDQSVPVFNEGRGLGTVQSSCGREGRGVDGGGAGTASSPPVNEGFPGRIERIGELGRTVQDIKK